MVLLPEDDLIRSMRERADFDENNEHFKKFKERVSSLRARGIKVEVRDGPSRTEHYSPHGVTNEIIEPLPMLPADESPVTILTRYFDEINESDQTLRDFAIDLIKDGNNDINNNGNINGVNVVFKNVRLKGFGCFRRECEFDLDGRGLNLILGRHNDDIDGDDKNNNGEAAERGSNGSGKSTIAFAPRWAILGSASSSASTSSASNKYQER